MAPVRPESVPGVPGGSGVRRSLVSSSAVRDNGWLCGFNPVASKASQDAA
jgi:hypothetical protein